MAASERGDEVTYTVSLEELSPYARIREIALDLFARHGPVHTSIRMVASAAGVSSGAVTHHFKSKEELEQAVLDVVLERLGKAMAGVGFAAPTTVETLNSRQAAYAEFLAANPPIAGYLRHVYFDGGPQAARVFNAMGLLQREQFDQLVEAGLARPLPDPEMGLLLYRAISMAPMLLSPFLEGGGLPHPDSPEFRRRFDAARADLLTRPFFISR
jgi:AcrR family transcriptional regulator